MNEMPLSWVTRPFGELNKFYGANIDPANHPPERFELYSIPAFPTGKPEQPLGSEVGSTKQLVEHNDVLISKINPRINRVWQVGPSMGLRQIASSEWIGFRSPQMDARFFRYYFTGPIFRDLLCSDVTGVGGSLTRAQPKRVSGFPVPVAPVDEQKRIADKLDTVLTRVEAVNTRLARVAPILKRFRQSVLAAATSGRLTEDWRAEASTSTDASDLIEALAVDHRSNGGHERGNASEPTREAHDLTTAQLPVGWQIGNLKDCCLPGRPITYGILMPGPELAEGVPYIRVADFPGNRLNLDGIKKTSSAIDLQYKRARLVAGDLLLSIRGSVGRLIEIPAILEGANITQDTARLSISKRLSTKYIYFALQSPDTQRRMANAVRGVAVRGINIGDVRALQVPIPTLDEQTEIVRRVETLFTFADRLEARLQTARTATERLTPALLAKAFRGELVPQDPNDESAAALLARIRSGSTTATTPTSGKPARGRSRQRTA